MKTYLVLSMVYGYKGPLHTGDWLSVVCSGSAERLLSSHQTYADQLQELTDGLAASLHESIVSDPNTLPALTSTNYLGIISHTAITVTEP
jgi:hypothetical protein